MGPPSPRPVPSRPHPSPSPLWRPLIPSPRGNVLAEMYGFSAGKNMHVDPHLAPRLMEVQIGFDCEALHLSSTLTRTDVQWVAAGWSYRVRVRARARGARACSCTRVLNRRIFIYFLNLCTFSLTLNLIITHN